MQNIQRRDPYLNEALEALDRYLVAAGGDIRKSWGCLKPGELTWIREEIFACAQNFRYYSENYHVIKTESEGLRSLYPWWESQEIFYEVVLELQVNGLPVRVIVLKARQEGISTIAQAMIFHKTIFTEGCNTMVVAQDMEQADYLFSMSRLAYDSLPWWMRPEARYERKGLYLEFDRKDERERIQNPGLRSQIVVAAANKMHGVGIGKTIRAGHLSEISAWMKSETLSRQLLPTMNADDELAVMESTARGRGNHWHRLWEASVNGKSLWTPVFIEWFRVKKYSRPITKSEKFELTEKETALRGKIKQDSGIWLTMEQLHWRRRRIEEFIALEGDEWGFYQEFPSNWMEAFQGSGMCAFNKRKLQDILETTACDPLYYGEIRLEGKNEPKAALVKVSKDRKDDFSIPPAEEYGSRFYVWELPKPDESYYVAADVGHGVQGGNFSCAQVIRIGKRNEKDVQVAEWHGWINPTPFAQVLAAIGYFYNTAQIAVECNDIGLAANNHLFRMLEYPNCFRWKHYDKIRNFMTDFFGWYTNSKTRPQIIAKFREAIDEGTIVLRSRGLVDECLDFSAVDQSSIRFEGQDTNDDRVLAIMIGNFCAHDSDWGVEMASAPREERRSDVDYVNTEFSPVHDQRGFRQRMLTERKIPSEVIMYSDQELSGVVAPEDRWKLY